MITQEFLRERFATGLARRLPELRRMLRSLDDDSGVLEDVMRAFHSLAGIGGTYGFPEVSTLARDAELRCNAILDTQRTPVATDLSALRSIIDRLAAIHETLGSHL